MIQINFTARKKEPLEALLISFIIIFLTHLEPFNNYCKREDASIKKIIFLPFSFQFQKIEFILNKHKDL